MDLLMVPQWHAERHYFGALLCKNTDHEQRLGWCQQHLETVNNVKITLQCQNKSCDTGNKCWKQLWQAPNSKSKQK